MTWDGEKIESRSNWCGNRLNWVDDLLLSLMYIIIQNTYVVNKLCQWMIMMFIPHPVRLIKFSLDSFINSCINNWTFVCATKAWHICKMLIPRLKKNLHNFDKYICFVNNPSNSKYIAWNRISFAAISYRFYFHCIHYFSQNIYPPPTKCETFNLIKKHRIRASIDFTCCKRYVANRSLVPSQFDPASYQLLKSYTAHTRLFIKADKSSAIFWFNIHKIDTTFQLNSRTYEFVDSHKIGVSLVLIQQPRTKVLMKHIPARNQKAEKKNKSKEYCVGRSIGALIDWWR